MLRFEFSGIDFMQSKNVVMYLLMGVSVCLLFFTMATTRLYSVDPSVLGLAGLCRLLFGLD